jgi:hypothetical protein
MYNSQAMARMESRRNDRQARNLNVEIRNKSESRIPNDVELRASPASGHSLPYKTAAKTKPNSGWDPVIGDWIGRGLQPQDDVQNKANSGPWDGRRAQPTPQEQGPSLQNKANLRAG